jgi:hypothetical protein
MQRRTVSLDELRGIIALVGYRVAARQTGVDVGTIHRFANGRPAQSDTLKKMADGLSVKVLID